MELEQIDPEFRRQTQFMPALPYRNIRLQPALALMLPLFAHTRVVSAVDSEKRRVGQAKVRIYRPADGQGSGAAMLWMHGGGMIVGAAGQDNRVCSTYARKLGLIVVSVDYRLAPKYPFPAALDDCFAAWNWLQASAAELRVDPERVAVAGESAGAGLAATLVQRIQDAGGPQPAAQLLFCPMLDDRTAADRQHDEINHRVWNNRDNRAGWAAYLGHEPGAAEEPEYSVAARRDDLSGQPPTWIGIGDIDLFFEEAQAYADRLTAAGVNCEFDVVPDAPHAFEAIAPKAPLTLAFRERSYGFLRKHLALPELVADMRAGKVGGRVVGDAAG